jgi:eukaryotic-like serine/threonine-protein kinase
MATSPPDETKLAETGFRSGGTPVSGGSSPGSRPGWLSSGSSASHEAIPPGALLGERYRILGLAGRGGMGEVYRAEDLRLGQSVALKFLPSAVAHDPQRLAQFHHEVRIARQVSHRNVCRVYDIGEDHGRVFLTMELVDGEDLASLLKRVGRFPEERATEIARQICAGLNAAHEQGVLHRDLKPANVMLDADGRVRITDFGLAGIAGSFTDIRSGTPAYMAPEQLAGKEVTERSDIFALGLVLYEIFTGKRAFDAATLADLLRMHDEGARLTKGSGTRDLDPAVERVILRCLAREPSARPASAIAVSAALPGGDPLAAALAAGETPSPAMVAAAGQIDAVPLRIGLTLVGLAVVLFAALVAVRSNTNFHRFLPAELSGPVLEDRARQAIARLGYPERPADTYGTFYVGGDYLRWARDRTGDDRWKQLASGRTPAFGYWYRTSPQPLKTLADGANPTDVDPPFRIEGMTLAYVDAKGYLFEFYRVPPQRVTGAAPAGPVDWQPVFDAVGWPRDRFAEAAPQWTPPLAADTRIAWTGTLPALGDTPLRLEAAAFGGKIVYAQAIGPWTKASRVADPPATGANKVMSVIAAMVLTSLFLGSSLLARRNVVAGRGDRAGATRVAAVVAVLLVVRWLVVVHHLGDYAVDQQAFLDAVAEALLPAAIIWLAYLGLEPWLRRHWPESLVSWTRLLGGSVRDPLVGRDVLIGVAWGLGSAIALAGMVFLSLYLKGVPPGPGFTGVNLLTSPNYVVGAFLNNVVNALMNGVLLSLLFVMLRRLLRLTVLATIATAALLAVLIIGQGGGIGDGWYSIVATGAYSLVMVLPLVRFGVLPFIVSFWAQNVVQSNVLTTDLGAWYAPPTWIVGALLIGLAIAGFVQSRAGAPLFGGLMEES